MIDKIIEEKRKLRSIFNIIPREMFRPDWSTDYLDSSNCFEWYFCLTKILQPKSIVEFGVRYAYSFLPMMIGAGDSLEYALGYDLETYGSIETASANISEHYTGKAKWELIHANTQELTELPQKFDLCSIDADHSYDGKLHDLNLAMKFCKYIILDDFNYMPDVGPAIEKFIKDNGANGWGRYGMIDWAIYIPTFRGSYLIKMKDD